MTTPTRHRLPLSASGCACCSPSTTAPAVGADRPAPAAQTPATYRVEGMTCGHCAGRVTEALSALEGVRDVQVELATAAVTITAATPPSAQAVREAVEQAGYGLTDS